MKPKVYGVVSLVICFLTFAGIGVYAQYAMNKSAVQQTMERIESLPPIKAPSAVQMRLMRQLDSQLDRLAYPKADPEPGADFSIFGYRKSPLPGARLDKDAQKENRAIDHVVTMAFSSGTSGFSMVDGVFYPLGAVLPDGCTIEKIESDRIFLRKDKIAGWIVLSPSALTEDHE
ncbi:MAG: hypothetical protein HKM93_23865 [Desulfobacteraceae bacterium]|nr:hypothetical protein [Desulfobacteraceae bacterium]